MPSVAELLAEMRSNGGRVDPLVLLAKGSDAERPGEPTPPPALVDNAAQAMPTPTTTQQPMPTQQQQSAPTNPYLSLSPDELRRLIEENDTKFEKLVTDNSDLLNVAPGTFSTLGQMMQVPSLRGYVGQALTDMLKPAKATTTKPGEGPWSQVSPLDATPESIEEWRKTVTPENPNGDPSVLRRKPAEQFGDLGTKQKESIARDVNRQYRADTRVKGYYALRPNVEALRSAPDDLVGDRMRIKILEKALDPTSAVLAGEQGGYAGTLNSLYEKAMNSLSTGGFIAPEIRKSIDDTIYKIYGEHERQNREAQEEYSLQLEDAGIHRRHLRTTPESSSDDESPSPRGGGGGRSSSGGGGDKPADRFHKQGDSFDRAN